MRDPYDRYQVFQDQLDREDELNRREAEWYADFWQRMRADSGIATTPKTDGSAALVEIAREFLRLAA